MPTGSTINTARRRQRSAIVVMAIDDRRPRPRETRNERHGCVAERLIAPGCNPGGPSGPRWFESIRTHQVMLDAKRDHDVATTSHVHALVTQRPECSPV